MSRDAPSCAFASLAAAESPAAAAAAAGDSAAAVAAAAYAVEDALARSALAAVSTAVPARAAAIATPMASWAAQRARAANQAHPRAPRPRHMKACPGHPLFASSPGSRCAPAGAPPRVALASDHAGDAADQQLAGRLAARGELQLRSAL